MHPIRLVAAATVSGVAVASLLATTAPASAKSSTSKTTDGAAAAAGFLARNLGGAHKDHFSYTYQGTSYADDGETADAVLSMDAAGVAQNAAKRATSYLESDVANYAGSATAGYYPGAIGKLMLVAEAQHINVGNFGGANLVTEVVSTEGAGDAQPGEYQQNAPGTPVADEYYSTVSQALAVLALANSQNSGAQPDAAAVSFLAAQQCSDGGWPTQLGSDPATACAAGSDVDSTSYAVQALLAADSHAAAHSGLVYLHKVERSNGSFGTPANANSTALATQALVAGHDSVTKPEHWLAGQQLGCSSSVRHRGAVKFTGSFDAASAVRATSQATEALARTPLAWVDRSGAHKAPALAC